MKNILIFASGSGSNAEKIIQYFKNLENFNSNFNIKIYSNNPNAGVIKRAENLNIPIQIFTKEEYRSPEFLNNIIEFNPNLIVLAGFLWLIPESFVKAFPNKIINLHPALLPNYGGKGMYGHFVHEAVIKNKEKESGITIHFVNENYDEGNIIHQAKYAISETDTPESIALKGQKLEHEWFPKIVDKLLN